MDAVDASAHVFHASTETQDHCMKRIDVCHAMAKVDASDAQTWPGLACVPSGVPPTKVQLAPVHTIRARLLPSNLQGAISDLAGWVNKVL